MKLDNTLEYKGYSTSVRFDSENMVLRGVINGIGDYVDFECDSVDQLEREFHSAVDDYLDFCREVGKSPDKEYKGTFNIRIAPELHKALAAISAMQGNSINNTVELAIQKYCAEETLQ